ncbi:phage lytic cycle repressor MrpR family protein [Paenibacillus medicaginis]|uniref:Integrase n=1 Tax=Paenibacillus medicaginis TaxID=1470560 RepID=A0ABV5BUS1_9BACL
MSNKIYEQGFFNEMQKRRYLKTFEKEKTAQISMRVLSRAKIIEEQYQTDLYNFNLEQIEQLLFYLNPATLASSRQNFFITQSYIRWGIEQDLRQTNINPMDAIADKEYYKKFIDKTKKTLFTIDEINDMVDICVNPQDAVVVLLLFNGAYGTIGYDELLNLTKNSLLGNNDLMLQDGNLKRVLKVSDKCYEMVEKALSQKMYIKKNGLVSSDLRSRAEADLDQSDYVLRNVSTRSKNVGKADLFLIQRRIAAVKSYNDLKTLTPSMIRNSGMLYMAKKMANGRKELTKEMYHEICDHFGFKSTMNNGYKTYHFHRLKEDFLNVETIKKVYEE